MTDGRKKGPLQDEREGVGNTRTDRRLPVYPEEGGETKRRPYHRGEHLACDEGKRIGDSKTHI